MGNYIFVLIGCLLGIIASTGCAQTNLAMEEWRTTIDCGGSRYFVISQCRASGDPFELNTCVPNQKLIFGDKSISVPAGKLRRQSTALYATHWNCIEEPQGSVIRLGYASGEGRGSNDEGTEFFDDQLRLIQDEKRINRFFQSLKKSRKGFVRSIMPGEGG